MVVKVIGWILTILGLLLLSVGVGLYLVKSPKGDEPGMWKRGSRGGWVRTEQYKKLESQAVARSWIFAGPGILLLVVGSGMVVHTAP